MMIERSLVYEYEQSHVQGQKILPKANITNSATSLQGISKLFLHHSPVMYIVLQRQDQTL